MIQPTVIVIRLSYGKTLNPLWIHYEGTPIFWIYRLPTSTKITKSCKVEGTTRSTDIDIEGAGILYTEDGCKVFSESFLLLSTASGSTNFTLTPGQVVAPELPIYFRKKSRKCFRITRTRQMGHLVPSTS